MEYRFIEERPEMYEGLRRYIDEGIMPGGFLQAMLENDLMGVFGRADNDNLNRIREYLFYLNNEVPYGCWGSSERVNEWIKDKNYPSGP